VQTLAHPISKSRGRRCGPRRPASTILRVEGLTVSAPDGSRILDGVSFSVPRGSVVAVVGPTGVGKTTLLNALTGSVNVDAGSVRLDGVDIIGCDEQARRRVGYVPQENALHGQLDLRRTLDYAASLRLPPTMNPARRAQRVTDVLAELGLTDRSHVAIANLSGGQRKRASVAVELIAEPDILVLDEPTSGLDPGYEKSMLGTLRDLADRGRTVLTVTHSLQALGLCDLALFLAPGGKVAFFGPPAEALAYFGTGDAADVFVALDAGPGEAWKIRFENDPAYARYVQGPELSVVPAGPQADERGTLSQLGVLVRRYVDLIRADRRQLLMLSLQGPLLGLLLAAVLTPRALRHMVDPNAVTVAVFVVISATWLGAASSVREIVKEQHILRREEGGGLSVGAYVVSKIVVLGAITMVQAAILAIVATAREDAPIRGAVLPNGTIERMVVAALTGVAAVAIGLMISALVTTPDKAMSVLPIVLVAQLVLSGGWVSVLSTPGLHQLADLTAARWGVQAFEATIRGDAGAWLPAVAALLALTAGATFIAVAVTRRRARPALARFDVRLFAVPMTALLGVAVLPLAVGAATGGGSAHAAKHIPVAATPIKVSVPATVTVVHPATTTVTTVTPVVHRATAMAPAVVHPVSTTPPTTAPAPLPNVVAAVTSTVATVTKPVVSAVTHALAPPKTVAPPTASAATPANGLASLFNLALQWWAASAHMATPVP
jgi:ABC-type multidrug transport system ATPase subunit